MKKLLLLIFILCHTILYAQTIEDAKKLFDDDKNYQSAIEIFEQYPNDGEALYYLGKAYLYGMGFEKDDKKAFEYAKKSANQNNSSGLNLLGVAYQYGEGVKKDELQALMYYKQAANLGNTKAMMNIGSMYVYGNAAQKNFKEAETWYQKSVKNGNKDALASLGELYWYDLKNNEKALEYFLKYEDDKKLQAYQYEIIGRIYELNENYTKAYNYYKKAVDLKFYEPTFKLYDFAFKNGLTDKQDEAIEYLKIATDNNDSMSVRTLVQYLINDIKEPQKAVDILKKSYYELGNIESGCSLASYTSLGDFEKELVSIYNPKESLKISNEITLKYPFHEKISSCYTALAYFYRQGNYVAKNNNKAIDIYKQIKEKYPATYIQNFSNEAINELENKIKEGNSIENEPKNKNISNENNLFTVIDNFSKVNQVVSLLNTNSYYFISTSDKSIKVIDKNTLQTITELRGYIANGMDGIVTSMAYDEKNKLLYCAGVNSTKNYILNDIIKVYDIRTGKIVKTIQNKKSMKNDFLNISDDGKYLVALNTQNKLNIINIETNEIQNFDFQSVNNFIFASIQNTSSDYLIHLVSKDFYFYTISHKQGKIISKVPFKNQIDTKSRTFIDQVTGNKILSNFESFVPINKLFYEDNNLKIELNNNKLFDFVSNHLELKSSVYNSKSNNTIFVKYLDNGSTLEILKDNQKIGLINFGDQKAIYHKIIDNKYIFVASSDFTLQCFFDLNGNPLLMLDGILFNQKNLIESENFLITHGEENIVHIWDKKVLLNSKYNQGVYDQNVLNLLSYAIGGDPTEMIKDYSEEDLFNMQKYMRLNYQLDSEKLKAYLKFFMTKKDTMKPLASLYIKNENDWILYTPEGLFTYGGNGKDLIKYHQNQGLYKEAKVINNDQLFDKFYRPDLIKKILAGEKVDIPMDVKSVILNIKPPKLNILDHVLKNKKDLDITYQICDDGNGIANPKLIINGQAINPPSSRAFTIESKNNDCKLYKSSLTLYPGKSQILLKAFDKDGYISNTSHILELEADYKIVEKSKKTDKTLSKNSTDLVLEKGNLYFVSLAVSDYENKNMNLKFPVSDVLSVQQSFVKNSNQTFEHIYSYNLVDRNVTLENFNTTIEKIVSQMKMNDTFVLYLAGHGTTTDGKYQFIPYAIGKKISIDSIKDNLSKIAAYTNKSLVMLDTCYSGAIIDNLNDKATTNRLAHDSNINYIVASSSDQVALEGYQNHGVFTYSVLEAFEKGNALKVWSLADYVSELVPKITQLEFHFEQNPQVFKANDFILGGKN